jgi:hypothetical protein
MDITLIIISALIIAGWAWSDWLDHKTETHDDRTPPNDES